jgi:integrase
MMSVAKNGESPAKKSVCLNPNCGREFVPGHYGDKQRVCSTGSYIVQCRKCKGKECRKCGGAGSYTETCQAWYRKYWSQTRRVPRAIPDAEFDRILSHLKSDRFWWSYFVVARESALRKGEQLGLTWADVLHGDGVRSSILVRGQWKDRQGFMPMKVGDGKVGYLMGPAQEAILVMLKTVKKEDGWASRRIWDVTRSSVWGKWTTLQRDLGIENPDSHEPYRVHDLRHTAAINAWRATGDITRAQKLLGHKNLATTTIYTQERPEDFVKDLEQKLGKKRKPGRGKGKGKR